MNKEIEAQHTLMVLGGLTMLVGMLFYLYPVIRGDPGLPALLHMLVGVGIMFLGYLVLKYGDPQLRKPNGGRKMMRGHRDWRRPLDCPKCKGKKTFQEGYCSKCGYDVS